MLQAYRQAGVDPRSVQYIEAHGIGSPMGDALEIEALKAAYAQLVSESKDNLPATTCNIGSLKPNLDIPRWRLVCVCSSRQSWRCKSECFPES